MLVTFTTLAYADITMFGEVAQTLLKLMGHSATVPGAILAEDVPAALSRLTAAMAADKAASSEMGKRVDKRVDKYEEETAVSLSHRALPLIELLAAAAKANTYVMWK